VIYDQALAAGGQSIAENAPKAQAVLQYVKMADKSGISNGVNAFLYYAQGKDQEAKDEIKGLIAQKVFDRVMQGLGQSQTATARLGVKLTGGGSKVLKDPALQAMKDSSVAQVIVRRGGGGAQVQQVASHLRDKSLGEVANLAATGDGAAITAIKLVKQAAKKAQKYGGK
jgi:hypothetical protein